MDTVFSLNKKHPCTDAKCSLIQGVKKYFTQCNVNYLTVQSISASSLTMCGSLGLCCIEIPPNLGKFVCITVVVIHKLLI